MYRAYYSIRSNKYGTFFKKFGMCMGLCLRPKEHLFPWCNNECMNSYPNASFALIEPLLSGYFKINHPPGIKPLPLSVGKL